MRRRRALGSVAAVVGVGLLAACAGAAAIDSWVQGSWTCTAVGADGDSTTASVDVGDGTWSAVVSDIGFTTGGEYAGAWSLASGALSVKTDGDDYLAGTFLGVPGDTDGLGRLAGAQWGDNEGTTSVNVTIDSVDITYTDESDSTVTSCVKQ